MKNILFCLVIILVISGCSFKTPPNQWQYKSVNAFDSYTKNFLSSNDITAKNDLNRAVKHSKSSADFSSLARVYLGECALNNMVGINDSCEDYQSMQELVEDNSLNAYYAFITKSIKKQQMQFLSDEYREFILHVESSNFDEANKDILKMQKITSSLLCAYLIKDKINSSTIDELIKKASFYGYKKAVIFWLNEKIEKTQNIDEKNKITKKIQIMQSLGRVKK